jgi:hypothetical protein
MLSNDALRPTFNTISHDWHAQIVNRKPHSLYRTVQFTYPYQNIVNTHRRDTIHWNIRVPARSWPT